MHKNDRISVIWLDDGEVKSDFACSMMDLFLAFPGRVTGRIVVRAGGAIVGPRNRSIDTFLTQTDDHWALLVDSDMSFTPQALQTLIDVADRKTCPIVGGLAFVHIGQDVGSFPMIQPTIFDQSPARPDGFMARYGYEKDSLVQCDATGAAFLLVHREVLLKMQDMTKLGAFSWFHDGPASDLISWVGEDVTFCNLARQAGFPIHVHTGAKIGHVKGVHYVLDEAMFDMIMAGVRTVQSTETEHADS